MSIIERFKDGLRAFTMPELKSAYNVTPVGVQGKPQRPSADIGSLMQAYRTSEIVFACINAKAQAAVDPRLIVERRKRGETWQEIDGHPLRRLIMRPNPMMDEAGFARAVLTSMDVAGVFYAEIVRAGNRPNGLPQALYPLDPVKMRPIPDGQGGVQAYEWRDGNVVQIIPAADILVWRNYDPQNRYQGLSPLSVALGSVAGDNMQTDYIRSFFDSGGIPSGILTIKNREVDQEESNIIRAKWRAKFNPRFGGIKEDIAVLDQNAEFQVLGSRLDQLQNEEVRSVAESRICMVFNVPPLIVYAYVGLLRATYSNLKEAWAQFWVSYLSPWFKQYRSWLTWSLLKEFESEDMIYGERIRLAHDMSDVAALQDDVDAKHIRARANLQAGGILVNEFREIIGQPADPVGGDIYLRGSSVLPVPWNETGIMVPVVVAPPQANVDTPPVPEPAKTGDMPPESSPARVGLPTGLKRMVIAPDVLQKALLDRDRIAERNVNKVERYLLGQYAKAAEAVRGYEKAGESLDAETKAARSMAQTISAMLDDGDEIAETIRGLLTAGLKKGHGDGASTISANLSFDLENERVQDVLGELLKQVKLDIPATTIEQIRGLIGKQASEGWSIDRLADEILATGGVQSPVRAEMIAHTETARAYTKGSLLAYADSGVVDSVEWSSFLDDKTSAICIGLNGKRVKLGNAFEGGFDGPPGHVRCRSALIPIVKG